MSDIVLKFRANLSTTQPDTFSKLYKLLVPDPLKTSSSLSAIRQIETICKFTKVLSISEDDDSYIFYAESVHNFMIVPIFKKDFDSSISQSNWHKATDLILRHCMGITTNITDTLINDFKNQLDAIERSTNSISELFYKYDKVMTNIKILISTSTILNATRPREILEDISSDVKKKAFNIVRQRILDRTVDYYNKKL